MTESSGSKEGHEHERHDLERVKTAREILEERLAKLKSEVPLAEQALREAADRAPDTGTGTGTGTAAEKERDEWKNDALRARADLDNYQKRVRREMEEFRAFAAAAVLGDVIAALDNLDLTLGAVRAKSPQGIQPDLETLVKGVEMVRDQLEKILGDRGAERIPAANVPFDARRHEAVLVEERADVPGGTAVEELRRGYALRDRVLRAAQVKVSKAPPGAEPPPAAGGSEKS